MIVYEERGDKYILGCKLTKKNSLLIVIGIIFCLFSYVVKNNGRFEVNWNLSKSLPYTFFVVDTVSIPKKGEYGAFNYYDASGVTEWDVKRGFIDPKGFRVTFIKQVVGVEGDIVKVVGREVYVNDEGVGRAKKNALSDNRALEPLVETGVIPKDKYYFKAPNKDSFDSRYSEIGLIDKSEVRGKAYPFF